MQTLLLLAILAQPPAAPAIGKAEAPVGKLERPAPAAWAEIKADPILTVLTAPEASKWILIDAGADLAPASDGKSATFAAPAVGRYRVLVVSPTGEASRVLVVVGDSPKPPPAPPIPGPVDPPAPPTPPVPVPVDPLVAKLQTAYNLDAREPAKKLDDLKNLIELYKLVADLAVDPEIGSTGTLVARMKAASVKLVAVGLTELRKVVSAELAIAFPNDAPLDDASRARAKVIFLRFAEALKSVK